MRILLFAALAVLLADSHANAQPNADKWMELNSEGIRRVHSGELSAAEEKFRAALLEAEHFGAQDFRLWATLSNLALTRQEQDDFATSEKLYRRVLELRERFLPPESAQIASSLNNLGATLHAAGRDTEADPLLRRALLIAENAHDDIATAATLNTLGLVLMTLGENARAEPVLRRAIALFEKAGGPDSLDAARAANNLATLYQRQGEFGKAEEQERRALPVYEKSLPPDHFLVATVHSNMFAILGAQKRFDEGEPHLRRALEIAERAAPSEMRMQQIRLNLAALEASRGNWRAAATVFEQVIAAQERLLGPNHPSLAQALASYSDALKHLNHKAEAKQAQRRADAIIKSFR